MPVFILSGGRLAAAVHAGWRSLAGGIVEKVLDLLPLSQVTVLAGPHICPECFEVGHEVSCLFPESSVKNGRADLFKALQIRLSVRGIGPENIRLMKTSGFCTCENTDYFSHRRGDDRRMAAFAIQY